MAKPKMDIEERLDRIELAVSMMSQWLVQAQTGFGAKDAEAIEKILRGDSTESLRETLLEREDNEPNVEA